MGKEPEKKTNPNPTGFKKEASMDFQIRMLCLQDVTSYIFCLETFPVVKPGII